MTDGVAAPRGFDAVLAGRRDWENYAYFFVGAQYARYRWGPGWLGLEPKLGRNVTEGFNGLPVDQIGRVSAAVNDHQGLAVLFFDRQHVRCNWDARSTRHGEVQSNDHLALPSHWNSRVDAATEFHGMSTHALLVRGSQWVIHDWVGKTCSEPRPLESLGLPSAFNAGIDGIVNGAGERRGSVYFFRGDRYTRYLWAESQSAEPPGRTAPGYEEPQPIGRMTNQKPWPGIVPVFVPPESGRDPFGVQAQSWGHPDDDGGVIGSIYFASGNADVVTEDDLRVLDHIAAHYIPKLNAGQGPLRLTYIGTADHRTHHAPGGNTALSAARAEAVKSYLDQKFGDHPAFSHIAAGHGVAIGSTGVDAKSLSPFRATHIFATPLTDRPAPPPVEPGLPSTHDFEVRQTASNVFSVPIVVLPGISLSRISDDLEVRYAGGSKTQAYRFLGSTLAAGYRASTKATPWVPLQTRMPLTVVDFAGPGLKFNVPHVEWAYFFLNNSNEFVGVARFTKLTLLPRTDSCPGGFERVGSPFP